MSKLTDALIRRTGFSEQELEEKHITELEKELGIKTTPPKVYVSSDMNDFKFVPQEVIENREKRFDKLVRRYNLA